MSKLFALVGCLLLALTSGALAQDAELSAADFSVADYSRAHHGDFDQQVYAANQGESLLKQALPGLVGAAAGGLIGYRFGGVVGAAVGGIGGFLVGKAAGDLYRLAYPGAPSASYTAIPIDTAATVTGASTLAADPSLVYGSTFQPAGDAASAIAVSPAEAQAAVDAAYLAYLEALKAGGTGEAQRDAYLTAKALLDAALARGR